MKRSARTRSFILIAVFALLTVYVFHWMRLNLTLGQDTQIYYDAARVLMDGRSAYLPYEIGKSFVYHPSVLSIMSLLVWLPFPAAYIIWSLLSFSAFSLSFFLIFTRFIRKQTPPRMLLSFALIMLFLGPFIENFYVGQINTFVSLLLLLCLLFDEGEQAIPAGICLAVAILLKTSPAIFLIFFFSQRRFQLIGVTLLAIALFSFLTLLQFGPQVYTDFLSVLGYIGGGRIELFDFYNLSIIAATYRLLAALHLAVPSEVIIWMYRLLFGGLFMVLMFRAWRGNYRSKEAVYWLIGAVLVIMTMLSPLVWYHHTVFLFLPLCLALRYRLQSGLAIIFLTQAERLLSYFTVIVVGGAINVPQLALALTAGTSAVSGQLWLLLLCIRQAEITSKGHVIA